MKKISLVKNKLGNLELDEIGKLILGILLLLILIFIIFYVIKGNLNSQSSNVQGVFTKFQ